MPEGEEKKENWFLKLMSACIVLVIFVAFYQFFLKKNYNFIVEVACDPTVEVCLERDCTNPDDCPSNELSIFKRYTLNAKDFQSCTNEDCTEACTTRIIQCELVECVEDPDYGETCTDPEAYVGEEEIEENMPTGDTEEIEKGAE